MCANYGDDVAFLLVYVREAHELDSGAPTTFAGADGAVILDPTTELERGHLRLDT